MMKRVVVPAILGISVCVLFAMPSAAQSDKPAFAPNAFIRIDARGQQALNDLRVAVRRGKRQGSNVVARLRIDLRASVNQQVDDLEAIVLHSPMERRRTVGRLRVHVGLLGEQRLDRSDVAGADRVGQLNVERGRRGKGQATGG